MSACSCWLFASWCPKPSASGGTRWYRSLSPDWGVLWRWALAAGRNRSICTSIWTGAELRMAAKFYDDTRPRLVGEPPLQKPAGRVLSAAHARLYDRWGLYHDSTSEFYTSFHHSQVTGIGKEEGITRRDPSTVVRIGDTYYVWYTRRQTAYDRDPLNRPPYRAEQSWEVPVYDWDLAEIWYATSKDGFHWQERGVAVPRGPRGGYDERSVFTPDILVANGNFYLYYQAVDYPYVNRTRNTIGMSWAESPDGPWHRWPEPVLRPGEPGEWLGDDDSNEVIRYGAWDSHKVHDPFILVRDGKFWLYYKGQPMGWGTRYCRGIGWGVAIAERPEGPFIKSPLNPITNSGHETCLFPYGEGVLAICGHDGPEKDTIQYAADGLNFEVVAHVVLPPCAAGPFAPDSYDNTKNGRGITWGLAHIATEELKRGNSYIVRFDCNLRRGRERPGFRRTNIRLPESVFFSPDMILTDAHKQEATPNAGREANIPVKPSEARPAGPISAAMQRVYEVYGVYKDQQSEFFSAFKYSPLSGIGKEGGITRRDPSKMIKIGDTYYVWYTRRQTTEPFRGVEQASETVPAYDWDLAEIWYATSQDGFHWTEQGRALAPGPRGAFDDRSVFSPDILVFGGRYYLYYQAVQGILRRRSIHQIGMAWSDSPDGPWQRWPKPILSPGGGAELLGEEDDPDMLVRFGTWDSHKVQHPFVFIREGQIWLYYKGVGFGRRYRHDLGCAWGVAFANTPEGPFTKSPLNPITNSGHETFLYPFRSGVVAITGLEGPEKNTVQYAEDGLNFEIVGKVSLPPIAAGPFIPDAFDDTKDAQGITWGLSHISHDDKGEMPNSYLVRFDCNLSRTVRRRGFYRPWNFRFPESAYFCAALRLTTAQYQEALTLNDRL
ncbi:MAG: hypothetical protein D6791_16015 [Chloroflexi bacterium]|nr:MAG: hypothetical protein D6791_16015 [Chloroflexota bacterium]